jgi:enterobactin synthetase component D / holo-[acyl-carrier protein] synthase
MSSLRSLLRRLLPGDVSCAAGPVADHAARLFDAERAIIEKAAAKRRDEFSSGRVSARTALADLGFPSCPIVANSHLVAAAAVARDD